MKLLIEGKYKEVGFWSFMKCNLLVELALLGIVYGIIFALAIIFAGVV